MNKLEIGKEYRTTPYSGSMIYVITNIFEDVKDESGNKLYVYKVRYGKNSPGQIYTDFFKDDDGFIFIKDLIIPKPWQEKYKEWIKGEKFLGWYIDKIEDTWLIGTIFYIVFKGKGCDLRRAINNSLDRDNYIATYDFSGHIKDTAFDAIWKKKGEK